MRAFHWTKDNKSGFGDRSNQFWVCEAKITCEMAFEKFLEGCKAEAETSGLGLARLCFAKLYGVMTQDWLTFVLPWNNYIYKNIYSINNLHNIQRDS